MKVYVKTPSRLHFGLIDIRGDLGRIFGSVGVAINKPNTILKVENSDKIIVQGNQSKRIKDFAENFMRKKHVEGGCKIEAKQVIPPHVGLGSGTQTALATATSISRLKGIISSTEELAGLTGRISVSSIGIQAFQTGGFIVDAGHKANYGDRSKKTRSKMAPVVFNNKFPENWLFILVSQPNNIRTSGKKEKGAFNKLPEVSEEVAGKMCRLVFSGLVPSIIDSDIKSFGKALTELDILTGRSFELSQGGIYSNESAEKCVNQMLKAGAAGAGQSSWGPTIYALTDNIKTAKKVISQLETLLGNLSDVSIVKANNNGATIRLIK